MKQTFLEWLFDIHRVPPQIVQAPPPAPLTALEVIREELNRLYTERDQLREDAINESSDIDEDVAYHALVALSDKLHNELIRRSQEESKVCETT